MGKLKRQVDRDCRLHMHTQAQAYTHTLTFLSFVGNFSTLTLLTNMGILIMNGPIKIQ